MPLQDFLQKLRQQGVLAGGAGSAAVRFVTHRDVSMADVQAAVEIIKGIMLQLTDKLCALTSQLPQT